MHVVFYKKQIFWLQPRVSYKLAFYKKLNVKTFHFEIWRYFKRKFADNFIFQKVKKQCRHLQNCNKIDYLK